MDNDRVHRNELPKIIDDGTNNNYGEWKTKSYHKLHEWDLLKYIEGPSSEPPPIPPLRETVTYHGVDDDGHLSTTHILGNAIKHAKAVTNAKPWLKENNIALSRIVAAIPSQQLHLVQNVKYAKQAWEKLRSTYQPRNSLRAATIKSQIMTYRCSADMNVAHWLNDMQRLYNSLCDLDIDRLSDRDFALTILDLMPQSDGWRDFLSILRTKVHESDANGLPIDSTSFTTAIRDEYWYRNKDDHQITSHLFSAHFEAQRRLANTAKRPRPADIVATSTSPNTPKRPRVANGSRADLRCTNSYCGSKSGHDTSDCVGYKGAKEGQYSDWWHGPWNIHLPESQRTKENNIPPKTHPAYARYQKATVNQAQIADNSLERSTTSNIQSNDDASHANSALASEPAYHAWCVTTDSTVAHTTLPILNLSVPRDNSCHHDSGANRHVFHDRSAFVDYHSIPPLTVKGFGKNLSAIAIGCGSVRLEGRYNGRRSQVLLNDVLHIPAARMNLISGVLLDKAGVVCTLGNKTITLSSNMVPIVGGKVVNDMYRLDLTIIPTTPASLASRIAPPTLISRINLSSTDPGFYTASWGT